MAGKSDDSGDRRFELGALERDGALCRFTLSDGRCDLSLNYESEENARRARLLIFEALRDVLQPGAETIARPSRSRIGSVTAWAARRLRRLRG